MEAKERAKAIYEDFVYRKDGARLYGDGCIAAIKTHIQEAQAGARQEAIEECITKIRTDCRACDGTGMRRYEAETYVSHDMALDAEQPEREGAVYSQEICEECEYCGRPIDAIRALLVSNPTSRLLKETND